MRTIFEAAGVALLLSLTMGCAQMFACTTDVTYIVRPDKTLEGSYSSCKEQTNFAADVDPSTGKASIKSDKSGTQESVIAASLLLQTKILDLLGPLLQKAAAGAATGGVPVPVK